MSGDLPVPTESRELTTNGIRRLTREQIELLKLNIAKGATDDELRLFVHVCDSTGLNPFIDEIYFWKSKGKAIIYPSIYGLRRKAAESGDYMGQAGPFWCGLDGLWRDIWISDKPPTAAKVGVYRRGNPEPTWAVVKWSEFQRQGRNIPTWDRQPAHQLAIVAERHALRKGCPGLVEKFQSSGVRMTDAGYLVAKIEQTHRVEAPPYRAAQPNMHEDLYGRSEPVQQSAAQTEMKSSEWTRADVAKFQQVVQNFNLSPKRWRELLGLSEDARGAALVTLGTVDEVITKLGNVLSELASAEDEFEDILPNPYWRKL